MKNPLSQLLPAVLMMCPAYAALDKEVAADYIAYHVWAEILDQDEVIRISDAAFFRTMLSHAKAASLKYLETKENPPMSEIEFQRMCQDYTQTALMAMNTMMEQQKEGVMERLSVAVSDGITLSNGVICMPVVHPQLPISRFAAARGYTTGNFVWNPGKLIYSCAPRAVMQVAAEIPPAAFWVFWIPESVLTEFEKEALGNEVSVCAVSLVLANRIPDHLWTELISSLPTRFRVPYSLVLEPDKAAEISYHAAYIKTEDLMYTLGENATDAETLARSFDRVAEQLPDIVSTMRKLQVLEQAVQHAAQHRDCHCFDEEES